MTPKEKAKELFNKYKLSFAGEISNEEDWDTLAKQCALIAVELVLSEFYADDFYPEVKKELQKL